MDNKKDPMDQIIIEDLLAEAESIDREMAGADMEEVPAGLKEEMKKRLHAQIDEYEKERVYAQLSEEDRKALELGKEMLKDKETEKPQEKVVHRKKSKKGYVAVAAVAVLVLAMGVTSIGGPERIAEMIGIKVGTREGVQVNTDEDNYIVISDEEEEAYQKLRDVFGVESVKLVYWPGEANFLSSEIDEDLQNATLVYEYQGELVNYFISSHHTESSWGIDVEDTITNEYYINHEKKGKIAVKEYEVIEDKIKRYSSNFTHKGLEYFILGTMEKHEFENLIKNLIFF